jgi:hypothetical protein
MQISQRRILTIQDRSLPYSIGAPPGLLIVIFALVAFFSMGILPIFVARDYPDQRWNGSGHYSSESFCFNFLTS